MQMQHRCRCQIFLNGRLGKASLPKNITNPFRGLAARHAAIPHNLQPNPPLLDFPECKTMSIDDPPRYEFDDQNNHAAKQCRNAWPYGVSKPG
jgi:hypothetical protein